MADARRHVHEHGGGIRLVIHVGNPLISLYLSVIYLVILKFVVQLLTYMSYPCVTNIARKQVEWALPTQHCPDFSQEAPPGGAPTPSGCSCTRINGLGKWAPQTARVHMQPWCTGHIHSSGSIIQLVKCVLYIRRKI